MPVVSRCFLCDNPAVGPARRIPRQALSRENSMTPSAPTQARLLIVDDDEQLAEALARRFQRTGHTATLASSGEQALEAAAQAPFDVVLLDLHLPGMDGLAVLAKLKELYPELEVILLTAHGSIETAIQAMRKGAYDYLTKPFHLPELEVHIDKAFEKVRLARRERQRIEQVRYESPRYRLVGSSAVMRKVVQLIEKVAPTGATVLIRGPSGSGKELVARALHFNSPRAARPLVAINCAALQRSE